MGGVEATLDPMRLGELCAFAAFGLDAASLPNIHKSY
jgi:hypothetical protein